MSDNKKVTQSKQAEQTANDVTDVRDITNGILYTKSGYSIGFLRLYPINIDLLSRSEKTSICNILTATFKPEKNSFILYTIPRTVDMEAYISSLTDIYDKEIVSPKRKMLLNSMISDATEKVMSGQNFEHQFYIKLWEKTSKKNSDRILKDRLKEFSARYNNVQNPTKELDDVDIIKLCNLFGNSNSAVLESYDENLQYTSMPFINEKR